LGALAFIGYQVVLARRSARDSYTVAAAEATRRAQQDTLDYYASTLSQRNELAAQLPDYTDTAGVAACLKEAQSDPSIGARLKPFLSYWELFATGANIGIYDTQTLRRVCGSRVVGIWDAWEPYVLARRVALGNRALYSELEALTAELREAIGQRPPADKISDVLPSG
jgi:hypothetical protein